MIIQRKKDLDHIRHLGKIFPVTALLGPRQSGKTFLAKQLKANHYFDLENPRDLAAFDNAQTLLENLKGTIAIDEIQRRPEIFPTLRYLVDHYPKQKYLILGSASGSLLRQSSESLAGRIGFHYLFGFNLYDVGIKELDKLWHRGGFPRSFLASSSRKSQIWLDEYLTTFLERDIPSFGISIPAPTLRRFWMMLAHYHGQVINFSEISQSFGISDMTVKKYIDILENTFMVRVLQPWYANLGKRLIKRPKIYLRDSGLLHRLLSISDTRQLLTHPKLGASWEGFALECIVRHLNLRPQEIFFWRTHEGAELDLLFQAKGRWWGIEFKYSDAPKLTKSMQIAVSDLKLQHLWIVYPGKEKYPLKPKITVLPLSSMLEENFS